MLPKSNPQTYLEWIDWLEYRSIMPVIKPGLENTLRALTQTELLPLIDKNKVIHIAGTNGKGTTAKTLEQLLISQGKSVGLYTSPHLIDTRERIRINNAQITELEFVTLCERYRPIIEQWNLSHFESLTLFACDAFFKLHSVDYAIFEIGLGGTWDATNAIPHSTSVITTLGLDHTHILGKTIEEIADNKFGIIHQGNTVFHFPYTKELEARLEAKIQREKAHIIKYIEPEFRIDESGHLPKYILNTAQGDAPLSLMGERAAQTMSLALQVYEALGFNVADGLPVLSKIVWPARMTRLESDLAAPVYLSGDHNIQGVKSLLEILSHARYKNLYFILGLSKNRTHSEFIEVLQSVPRAQIILTRPEFNGIDPESQDYPFYPTPQLALESLRSSVQADDLVVVTGSLYLCGDLLS